MSMLNDVISSSKFGFIAPAIASISAWWLEWGIPVLSVITTLLGAVLWIVLIRKHLYETSLIIQKKRNLKSKNIDTT